MNKESFNEIINEVCESAIISFHIETQENIIPINKNSKKRLKNIKQWSRNVKKTKLNLEEAYINNSRKKLIKSSYYPLVILINANLNVPHYLH